MFYLLKIKKELSTLKGEWYYYKSNTSTKLKETRIIKQKKKNPAK